MGATAGREQSKQKGLRTRMIRAHAFVCWGHIPVAWGRCRVRIGWTNYRWNFNSKILILREEDLFLPLKGIFKIFGHRCVMSSRKNLRAYPLVSLVLLAGYGFATSVSLSEMQPSMSFRTMKERTAFSDGFI